MNEQWRCIEGFAYYEVSDQGRVRSLDRFVQGKHSLRRAKGRTLKATRKRSRRDGKPSLVVNITIGNQRRVHILVAQAFIPIPPELLGKPVEVNHKDANRENNVVGNLEWRTHIGNIQHAVQNELCGDGVYFYRARNKWIARYNPVPFYTKHIGVFDTYAEAKAARDAAISNMEKIL